MPSKIVLFITCIVLLCAYAEPIKPIEFPDSIRSAIPKGSTGSVRIRAQHPTDNIYSNGEFLGAGTVRISLDTGTHSLEVQRKGETAYRKEVSLKHARKYDIKLWENQRSKILTVGVGGIIVSDKRDGTHYHPIVQAELGFIIRDVFMHGILLQFDPLKGNWKDTTNGQPEMYYRSAYYQMEKRVTLPKNFSLHLGLKGGVGLGRDDKSYRDSIMAYIFDEPEHYLDEVDTANDSYLKQIIDVRHTTGSWYTHWGGPSIRLLWGKERFNIQAMYAQSYGLNGKDDSKGSYYIPDKVVYILDDSGELEELRWWSNSYNWEFSIAHNFSLSLALLF